MVRKRLTEIFPRLLPLRQKQRQLFFYSKMKLDGRNYASTVKKDKTLPYLLFSSCSNIYNEHTGFPMIYQENKAFNLKLLAQCIDGVLIYPRETFSFWQLARYADRDTAYKDGLSIANGKLSVAHGGGLCQMSNDLFWAFLHTPLDITERHGHGVKEFPDSTNEQIKGVDATVAEGWLDLKATNNTSNTFQIRVSFNEKQMIISVYTLYRPQFIYRIFNKDLTYYHQGDAVYEEVDVCRRSSTFLDNKNPSVEHLYSNICRIGYPLPQGTKISHRGE